MRLDPHTLLDRVPDAPRCVEARALLLAGTCDVYGTPDGFVARSRIVPLGAAVGAPAREVLGGVLADAPPGFDLLLHERADRDHVRPLLPGWGLEAATAHVPGDAMPVDAPRVDVRIADPPDAASVYALPEPWRLWAASSAAIATVWAGGRAVTVCEAVAVTERYWEVGISTREGYRRRGFARAAYLALARHMGADRSPVWGALDTNEASLRLARRLGFEPAERLWLMRPPG